MRSEKRSSNANGNRQARGAECDVQMCRAPLRTAMHPSLFGGRLPTAYSIECATCSLQRQFRDSNVPLICVCTTSMPLSTARCYSVLFAYLMRRMSPSIALAVRLRVGSECRIAQVRPTRRVCGCIVATASADLVNFGWRLCLRSVRCALLCTPALKWKTCRSVWRGVHHRRPCDTAALAANFTEQRGLIAVQFQ